MTAAKINASMIEHIPLFTSLPASERKHLAEILHYSETPDSTLLFREGDPGNSLYILLDGQVNVIQAIDTSEERVLRTFGPGDYFGEMSLLERGGSRTASVRSISPLKMLEVTRSDFDELLQRWPTLGVEMLRELSLRMRITEKATILELQEKNRQLAEAYEELKAAQAQIIEKERLERELQVARRIQMSLLPNKFPQVKGYEFGATILPARAVGGDLFDFVQLDDHRTGILIGDVSDKGVPAALFMALTRSLFRAEASLGLPPSEVIRMVNRHLLDMNEAGMFVTLLYGILNHASGEFHYARAGHEVPLIVRADAEIEEPSFSSGQLVGVFPEPDLDEQTVIIQPGGAILLFTDGVTDASNPQSDFFGHERLVKALYKYNTQSAQAMCEQILQEILEFQSTANQIDDITLVAFKSISPR